MKGRLGSFAAIAWVETWQERVIACVHLRARLIECEVGKFWVNYSENMPSPLFEESLKFMRVLLEIIIHNMCSYCTLFLSHAESRIWNQTNAGGHRSFYIPHSTMALPGLYVTLTHSSCCWEWYQGWLAVNGCVGGWQTGEEGWKSKTEGRGRREGGRVVGLRNLLTFNFNFIGMN